MNLIKKGSEPPPLKPLRLIITAWFINSKKEKNSLMKDFLKKRGLTLYCLEEKHGQQVAVSRATSFSPRIPCTIFFLNPISNLGLNSSGTIWSTRWFNRCCLD